MGLNSKLRVNLNFQSPIKLELDFTISENDILAITGRSGIGKSTILRTIVGLPTDLNTRVTGEIHFNQETWFNNEHFLPIEKRQIGVVLQNYIFLPHLTILENILLGNKSGRAICSEYATLFKIHHILNKYPSNVSGGEKQRAAIIRAISRSPSLLIYDEPFAALDYNNRNIVTEALSKIQVPQVIFAHDANQLNNLQNKIIDL